MAIAIKSDSPLVSGDTTTILSDKLNEIWFTDSNSSLYALIIRKNADGNYDLLSQNILRGYDNGTNYDYRFSFDRYIKIQYDDLTYNNGAYGGYITYDENKLRCRTLLLLSTSNIIVANVGTGANIQTKSNGEMYVTAANMSNWAGLSWASAFTFQNFDNFTINAQQKLYQNSKFIFNIGLSANYVIDYTKFYDANGTLLTGGFTAGGAFGNSTSYVTVFLDVPVGTAYMKYRYIINSVNQPEVTIYTSTCARNQYFYFGKSNSLFPIAELTCTGKREIKNGVVKKSLLNNNSEKIYSITNTYGFEQNTGLYLTQNNILDLTNTPFIFEIDSTDIEYYLIDNEEFSGYETRNIGERNDVINIRKRKSITTYTNYQNNFYN